MRIHIHPEDVAAARLGIRRSHEWHKVEQLHLRMEPSCACCAGAHSSSTPLQVHHIFPFHYAIALGRPDLELDQRNLITLCESEAGRPGENHHLLVGHLDNFESSNLDVVRDARLYRGMTAKQIRASVCWQAAVGKRLKPLGEMSEAERLAFVKLMNVKMPRR